MMLQALHGGVVVDVAVGFGVGVALPPVEVAPQAASTNTSTLNAAVVKMIRQRTGGIEGDRRIGTLNGGEDLDMGQCSFP